MPLADHPGLGCDCYGGCWGDHSKEWHVVQYEVHLHKTVQIYCRDNLDYGYYVFMGDNGAGVETLRLARVRDRNDVTAFLTGTIWRRADGEEKE